MHAGTAARTGFMLDIDHHFIARQMCRQRTVIAGAASGVRSGFGPVSRLGRVLGGLVLGNGLFLILKSELELFNRQLFGAPTKLMARQAIDQQP
jgi:hypothetical protein